MTAVPRPLPRRPVAYQVAVGAHVPLPDEERVTLAELAEDAVGLALLLVIGVGAMALLIGGVAP